MSRIGYHTAASAVMAFQMGMDIAGNNLANVNTMGFKPSRPDFADLIYTERRVDQTVDTGHGVKIDKTALMFEQSILVETNRGLDFAALDEALFAVETTSGDVEYTKDGAFYMYEPDGTLRDSNGGYVLDYEGNRIEVPMIDGNIDFDELYKMVGVYTFPNPYGLDQDGLNYFRATPSSGEAVSAPNAKKKQRWLERSSTSVADEMVNVITLQRAFQLNVNMVKIHDQLEDRINNLR